MGSTKHPLTAQELQTLDMAISRIDKTKTKAKWLYKALMTFRYTGMHSSALYRPESNIREINRDGILTVVWFRPMKGGEKGKKNYWKEVRGVTKSKAIDFNIEVFYKANLRSKRKYPAWKQLIYDRVNNFGKGIGISHLSPNTLRHTSFMLFFDMAIPEKDIVEMTGTSIKTIRDHYKRLGPKSTAELMRSKDW